MRSEKRDFQISIRLTSRQGEFIKKLIDENELRSFSDFIADALNVYIPIYEQHKTKKEPSIILSIEDSEKFIRQAVRDEIEKIKT